MTLIAKLQMKFKEDYIGLEVFRADADMLKLKVVDPFYKETMYV